MRNSDIARIIRPFENRRPAVHSPEQRRNPRWPYPVIQLVAFHDEDQQPTKKMLRAVRCHDISLSGISFFLSSPPPLKHCTVVLGRQPKMIFVRARVVHYEAQGASLREWKIGCQFIEKVESFLSGG